MGCRGARYLIRDGKLQAGALAAGSAVPEFLPVRVQAAAPLRVTAEPPMASPVTGWSASLEWPHL